MWTLECRHYTLFPCLNSSINPLETEVGTLNSLIRTLHSPCGLKSVCTAQRALEHTPLWWSLDVLFDVAIKQCTHNDDVLLYFEHHSDQFFWPGRIKASIERLHNAIGQTMPSQWLYNYHLIRQYLLFVETFKRCFMSSFRQVTFDSVSKVGTLLIGTFCWRRSAAKACGKPHLYCGYNHYTCS